MNTPVSWQAIERKAKQYNISFERVDKRVTLEYLPTHSYGDFYTDSGHEEQTRQQAQRWLENTCEMIDVLKNAPKPKPKPRKKFLGLF
ncbi:MAG TPA: hypothetical protein VNG51_01335 [Ktedonobacteraceae bacterium]|nr:hypothetical protein [Ktedonobacteraceae bacterium]